MRSAAWACFLGLAACGARAPAPTLRALLAFEEDSRECAVRLEGERLLASCDDEEVVCAPITRGRLLPGESAAEVWGCPMPGSGVEGWRAVVVTHRGGIVLSRGAPAFGSVTEVRVAPLVPGDEVDELVVIEGGEGRWWNVLRWNGTQLAEAGGVTTLEYAGCSRTVTVRPDGDLDVQSFADEEAGETERWTWSASEARFVGAEPPCLYGSEYDDDDASYGDDPSYEDGSDDGDGSYEDGPATEESDDGAESDDDGAYEDE